MITEGQLIKEYGCDIVSRAVEYFRELNIHFTMYELEQRCKQLKQLI